MTTWIKPVEGGVELDVHIQPGAANSELVGLHGDALKIRIRARAVEGAANAALIEFVATCLGVSRRAVRIVRGDKSRRKSVWVAVQADEAERRLTEQLTEQCMGNMA